ncbi:phosphatase PAP2 family protein [Cytobacillus gottheilii]|uniref:phosphatase PAP2 family protein n=1 Tax=Cytobacillus gottheilii TaxID=859144 RepID=UPI0021494DE2|nr:phosphatase PAP2 family protein [Cytobacillus gottheilii]
MANIVYSRSSSRVFTIEHWVIEEKRNGEKYRRMIFNHIRKQKIFYWFAIIGCISLFLFTFIQLVDALDESELLAYEMIVINFVQSFLRPQLTEIIIAFTFLGSVPWITIGTIIAVVILLYKKKMDLAILMAAANLFGGLFNLLLKWIFKRERPDIQPLITEAGFSFPSGHSMGSFIFYGTIAYLIVLLAERKLFVIIGCFMMGLMILGIGLSRIYLGVHYPSDVLAGFSAGAVWLIVCALFLKLYKYRLKRRYRGMM